MECPRRLMKSIACSPAERHSRSACASRAENTEWLPRSNSPRMSTSSTSGRGRPFTRSGISSSSSRFSGRTPGIARMKLEMEGVALPSTSAAPLVSARRQATSRASYRGRLSDW